jgi:hypothetical protein
MTTNVKAVDTKIPKINEIAKPLKIGSSSMKKAPSIAANPVKAIG